MFGFFALSEYPFSTITRDGYAYASFPETVVTAFTAAGSGDANVYVTLYTEVVIAPTVQATGGANAPANIGTLSITVPDVLAYEFKFTAAERTIGVLQENRVSLIFKESRIISPIESRIVEITSDSRILWIFNENRTLEVIDG
jgi:hypothetical protein